MRACCLRWEQQTRHSVDSHVTSLGKIKCPPETIQIQKCLGWILWMGITLEVMGSHQFMLDQEVSNHDKGVIIILPYPDLKWSEAKTRCNMRTSPCYHEMVSLVSTILPLAQHCQDIAVILPFHTDWSPHVRSGMNPTPRLKLHLLINLSMESAVWQTTRPNP